MEVLKYEDQPVSFPAHFHEAYCISIINKGLFHENDQSVLAGSMVISHPYEVHENKSTDSIASFSSIYINEDVFKYFAKSDRIFFEDKVIKDPYLRDSLNHIVNLLGVNEKKEDVNWQTSKLLSQIIPYVSFRFGGLKEILGTKKVPLLEDVKQYLDEKLNWKIDLTKLAERFGMNKFRFIRWFKSQVGLTPFEYIQMKRIDLGKKLIRQGCPLVDVSLEAGFYDQSHFSNYFKKYVGISPHTYRKNCNIFQEFKP